MRRIHIALLLSFLTMMPMQAMADDWTDITLPYTISAPGNYRLTSSYSGTTGFAVLVITANNVVFDGQGRTVALTAGSYGNIGIWLQAYGVTIRNVTVTGGFHSIYAVSSGNFTVQDFRASGSSIGIQADGLSNFTMERCTFGTMGSYGIYADGAHDFTFSDSTIDGIGNVGMYLVSNYGFSIQNTTVSDSVNADVNIQSAHDFAISNCTMENATTSFGIFSDYAKDFVISNTTFRNNKYGIHSNYADNATVDSCIFDGNGAGVSNTGAFESGDSNYTVSNNVFTNNYNAFIFAAYNDYEPDTMYWHSNTFSGNDYTIWFDYERAANDSQTQFVFYNNVVNDTDFIDESGPMPVNESVIMFNTTLQNGTRIYSTGPQVGGNYWSTPAGTGWCQNETDENRDGFIDTPFNVFASYYDYLPLSTNYTLYSIIASSGSGGTVSPEGTLFLMHGQSQSYTISPSTGYHVVSIILDGVSVGTSGGAQTISFESVIGNHTLSASFAANPVETVRTSISTVLIPQDRNANATNVTSNASATNDIDSTEAHVEDLNVTVNEAPSDSSPGLIASYLATLVPERVASAIETLIMWLIGLYA